jgi:hypothetical protein
MGHANLAWAAWRDGNLAAAEQEARRAVGLWQSLSLDFPLEWVAAWPLAAVSLEAGRLDEAIELAERMLRPSQQKLPAPLESALAEAVQAWRAGRVDEARAAMNGAARPARELGYL